jgi:hypothetical protein
MDPVRELPYRLAAITIAASEAGQMAASDKRVRPLQKPLASKGASTDGKRTLDNRPAIEQSDPASNREGKKYDQPDS